ncbi:flagellar protein export ATPase FliI [Rickettsiales endosymbiont of Stachyamoeba lipophora]|uniref:flagellar protein export ATPase FliI n=1 Tax=Rickettsiales endosymbiont of Stachyamoeba lipophora TaxID=2486578 RepID=UPI000F65421B|nr:flagellar protein export ATPase FliI [Rickettsiales endosymbiont of Stachyamoeba lipophora]AZL14957.1 flagellar protein export ATPase FliI [Rickettsiales endosymbiont of Stachyamoeba lipophora]
MQIDLNHLKSSINKLRDFSIFGKVSQIKGLVIEAKGLSNLAVIGSRCIIHNKFGEEVLAETIGIDSKTIKLIPFAEVDGIGVGCLVELVSMQSAVFPHPSWRGRILNYNGEPIDDKGPIFNGTLPYPLKSQPPSAGKRRKVAGKLDLGIRSLNTFTTCCYGQRMGIFAGSGVGKSVMMSMITKYAHTDIKVIGLIGERGREVKEFIDEYIGEEGLKNAVIIVATSDETSVARRQAAYLTLAVAEYFRDQNKEVLCMIDSITRFAMAQREIGLSNGEPPTTKGYPPTVFAELPKLLERAGPGTETQGNITGLFTVLVEGDDTNEPIADTVRGILDGHIVLERAIAERGRFPAMNILKSISRTMPGCNNALENKIVTIAKRHMSEYENMADLIKLGAYRKGSNPNVDQAIEYYEPIENFLLQAPHEATSLSECYQKLAKILNIDITKE